MHNQLAPGAGWGCYPIFAHSKLVVFEGEPPPKVILRSPQHVLGFSVVPFYLFLGGGFPY